ncbi:TonB-dependent receptor [Antarcticibacterium arcticum]|uniref:TonB-dependent receptor n=1 Tax=Antarcticibacterium arcticum TaxID=2585771 RepID=A0A5B8YKW9_9FLAO|nr:carboxypeptidase-like regulatory domain-containing protein [Antarcticibacterium arcticum]QED38345.1 TonB-dependent receptor [Antarcticibacterium arcticum]
MKQGLYLFLWGILSVFKVHGQQTSLRGVVVDASTYEPVENTLVIIDGTTFQTLTNATGTFIFSSEEIPEGNQILTFTRSGYASLRLPVIIIKSTDKNLDLIPLEIDMFREQMLMGAISLSDAQLSEEEGNVDNVAGLLQASRDVFLNAAAFDFSQTFFRPRGLDSEYGKVYINGVEMNKIFNGRPQWSNWGGLNDVQRNQVVSTATVPSEVGFGGLAGTTNIIMRASAYGKGGRVSYAMANRSYTGRIMATYNSGELERGWTYSVSASRRFATEGFIDGTAYDANSLFISAEKKINDFHSLNFSGFYTPNFRGKSSANTQEVYDLKGQQYNSFWGYQNGEIRNSRYREIEEPVVMLNHFWKLSRNTQINSNLAYQFGKIANSRIDFGGTRLVSQPNGQESFVGGGSNPDPAYYQKLPSYFLRAANNPNYMGAYIAQQELINNGQLNWNELYNANLTSLQNGGNSIYILAEDRNDDQQITVNSILNTTFNERLKLISKLTYTKLISENFASVKDLLGGSGYLDVDFFAQANENSLIGDRGQNDFRNRNRIANQGDRFKYNFELLATVLEAYSQLQFKTRRSDLYFAGQISQTTYQRNGLFQNGSYPNNSLGKSDLLNFTNIGLKTGGTYRFTGRHLLDYNLSYYTRPPTLRNSFSNSRMNNEIVRDLSNEQLFSGDLNYIFRTPLFRLRLTGYFTEVQDGTAISFYYADGLSEMGRTGATAFVQEVMTNIDKRHFGIESGVEYQITSTIKVKGAVAIGQYTYNNNPRLSLTSDSFTEPINYWVSNLKNYRVGGGPQRAAQLGFEYRDPNFWWFGTTVNFFSHAFINVSPITRTSNFLTDVDGLPIINYDEGTAKELLKQEQFDSYVLMNAIGGKSWRIKNNYLGFFVSLNNILDVIYKTGGFEQSRNANYPALKEDRERDQPLFGSKYWYGTGASYYANVYYRF